MGKTLTAKAVEKAKPGAKRREVPDGLLPGLYLVIQPSGTRSWAVRYRHADRTRKMTLGSFPAVTLAQARESGAAALRAAAAGNDPGQANIEKHRIAVPDVIEATVADFFERHCRRSNKPRTAEETERLFKLHVIPAWKGRTVQSIARRDVLDLLDDLVDAGKPVAANRTLTAVKTFFTWCIGRDIITASPAAAVKKPTAERSRDRILTDLELRAVWQAAKSLCGPFGALVKLLILTGQRRDEVAAMRWDEINLQTRTWTLPAARTKNKRQHDIPITDAMLAILNAQPRIKGCAYILTNDGKTAASNYGKSKRALDALLPPDMPHWVLHDLRRSCASGMARLGVSLPIIEKVLNHVSGSFGGIVSVYQRHDFAGEKRAAMDAWAKHIMGLTEDEGNTILLASRRAP